MVSNQTNPITRRPKSLMLASLVALWVAAQTPELVRLALASPRYTLIPVAWFFFFLYALRSPKVWLSSSPLRRSIAITLVLLGGAIVILGAFFLTFKIAWLGILLATTGLFLIITGVVPWTRVAAITSLIWVAWPWPLDLNSRIDNKIHQLSTQTAVATFDLVNVPAYAHDNLIEFRPATLDTSVWTNGPDSFMGLLFFSVLGLVWLRRPLVCSIVSLGFVPLIAWVGEAAKILLWYWGLSSFAADWSDGWALIGLRLGVFAVQIAMIFLVNFGVHWALLPVVADVNARSNLTMHSLYNVVTLWPLQVSLTAQQADQEYLEDDFDDQPKKRPKYLAQRRMPDVEAAKKATNPWDHPKLWWATVGLGAAAVLFTIVGYFVPAPRTLALPAFTAETVQKIATNQVFEGIEIPAQFTNVAVEQLNDQYLVSWSFASNAGPMTLQTRFPSRSTSPMWILPRGMRSEGTSVPYVFEDVLMFENSFQGQMGAASMGWFAAMTPEGQSIREPGFWNRMRVRLANSIAGRLSGLTNDQLMYETALIVEAPSSFTERQKREYRVLFSKLTKRVVESVRSIQP